MSEFINTSTQRRRALRQAQGKQAAELLARQRELTVANDLLSDLAAFHEEDIAHLDVNPNNSLVSGRDASDLGTVLIDFGNSCIGEARSERLDRYLREAAERLGRDISREVNFDKVLRCGPRSSPLYIDPRIAAAEWPSDTARRFEYAEQVDVFAAGLTLLELALGSTLFRLADDKKIKLPERFGQIFFTPGEEIFARVADDSPLKPIAREMLGDFEQRLKTNQTMRSFQRKVEEEKRRVDALVARQQREQ